ncbi:MAG: gas vesicle protein GvpD P-loop domain-containing protein, partial [Candidatus Jordarchaeaceae archaeon]
MFVELIPSEVVDALSTQRCYKLLVKGAPGAGKTLLALSICAFLNKKSPAIYLSTRVTPESLYGTYPWIREIITPKYVLDATVSRHRPSGDIAVAFKYMEKPAFLQAIYELCVQSPKPSAIIVDSLDALKETLKIDKEDCSIEGA